MEKRWCSACGDEFSPDARTPKQAYCSKTSCQRERRRLWQLLKRRSDPDYLENQDRAQRNWLIAHDDYWREYRKKHPEYVENNRQKQQVRRQKAVAKMGAIQIRHPLPDGLYELRVLNAAGVASMDAITVRLSILTDR